MDTDPCAFWYDFVDPGSYLVYALLRRRLGASVGEAVEMRPLELRPPGGALLDPGRPEWAAMDRNLRAIARSEEIPFSPPELVPWTRKAHELALHAEEEGRSIHGLLFAARFEEGLDLGRVDVLVGIAERAGLEGSVARTVLGVDRFAPAVEEVRAGAVRLGVRGVPTLVAGERRLEGFRSPEELLRFAETAGMG